MSDAALDAVLDAVQRCKAWMVTCTILRVPDGLPGGRPIEGRHAAVPRIEGY